MTKRQSSKLSELIARVQRATSARGKKSELARWLGTSPQRVNDWLRAGQRPGGEVTLLLLEWVTAEEAKQKQNPRSVQPPRGQKARRKNILKAQLRVLLGRTLADGLTLNSLTEELGLLKSQPLTQAPSVTDYVELEPALRAAAQRKVKAMGITLAQLIPLAVESELANSEKRMADFIETMEFLFPVESDRRKAFARIQKEETMPKRP